ncbi:MAG: thermonuclease family protein [Candidatus Saccharimonadales bacterium]
MRYRLRRKHGVSLLVILAALFVALGQQFGWFGTVKKEVVTSQPGLYSIARFVDGDTISVNMNGKVETIRFIVVDTPETHKPNTPVQCYGPAAAAYTKNTIGDQRVRLASDPESTNRDRYNRLLRYVYLPDGRLLEAELLKNGYAFAYTQFPFTKSQEFIADQAAAKEANKGLWGNCKPFQESNGRWQTENAS